MQCDFKYADLLDDDVFKLVFGQESSKDVMVEFLNQVITDRNIVDLDFMDKEMRPSERGKKKYIDVIARKDGKLVTVRKGTYNVYTLLEKNESGT